MAVTKDITEAQINLNEPLGTFKGKYRVRKCYTAARERNFGIFGITKGGRCFSGEHALDFYQRFEKSTKCNRKGTGGNGAYDVYLIAGKSRKT